MQRFLSYRMLNALLVMGSVVGMVFAFFFLQKYLNLAPCPLCVFQRIGLIGMGLFALLATLLNTKSFVPRLILWLGTAIGIGWSLFVAARHVWLQHLPPEQVPSCGPGLDYWLDALPMQDVVNQVLSGSGECAEIAWQFMGLSIPEQALIFFSVLALITLTLLWRIIKDKQIDRGRHHYKNTVVK